MSHVSKELRSAEFMEKFWMLTIEILDEASFAGF